MTIATTLYLLVFVGVLLACVKPLGTYMAKAMEGRIKLPATVRTEGMIYRLLGTDPSHEMSWQHYALGLLVFNTLGLLVVYALQRLQAWLPLNPQGFANVSADSSFNTAISFASNTNWQGYGGETTMGYLTQMAGLDVQNFLSAASGIVVAIALIRGFARHSAATIGNVWADLTRCTLYILLPLSVVFALFLVSQGVVQNFDAYKEVATVEAVTYQQPKLDTNGAAPVDAAGNPVMEEAATQVQTLPMGPAASQIAIKQLGTNGGGFFNANSAHPYENPTPLTNFFELLSILLIAAALCYTFGHMVGDRRQGWAIFAAMTLLFIGLLAVAEWAEQAGNPQFVALGVDSAPGTLQPGGNMEGKEARFGIGSSVLWATATTVASNGSVNSMHDSYTPLGGLVPLFAMQLGEVVYGGVGSGLYGMLIFALVGVFIAGLMIGRTPEYLGKKIEAFEMKMSAIVILIVPLVVLVGTAVAVSVEAGTKGVANPGAHGFSEILYAFTSAGNNNGSAFAGLSANTPFYNTALGLAMWFGRFWPLIAVLAIAGSLAAKKRVPATAGTMPTHGPLFVVLLIGTVLLVGALTYVPALALGPIVEHLMLWNAG